jgi:predicted amidohydrolase
MPLIRVATTQYRTGNDVQANLKTLLGYIDEAAEGGARLVVGPEFGNHTSFYADADEAWDVAITPGGDYMGAIQERARQHGIHVAFNATCRGDERPVIHISNFLVGPDGELIGRADKQVLMGGESEHLTPATCGGAVFDTAIGRIGMMSCLDGVPPETARQLALMGAQIITNSHNSCALDEPYGHIPARAAENRVWVIASGKVGPVCVDEMLEPLAAMIDAPAHLITALGENPILDPQGDAVARLPTEQAGIVFADIDLSLSDDKGWANGDLFADRRPDLYRAVCEPPFTFTGPAVEPYLAGIVQVRCDRSFEENCNRALDLVADASINGARLMVLPELCTLNRSEVCADPAGAAQRSRRFEAALAAVCAEHNIHVATSLVDRDGDDFYHAGILLNGRGERVVNSHQTHLGDDFKPWCTAGESLEVFDTELGRMGMMMGYDAVFPEVATVLARKGAEVLLHPTAWNFPWEIRYILSERAAENRVTVLSASRSDSGVARGGLINAMPSSQPLRARDLVPIWPMEAPHDRELHITATIYPARSRDKDLLGFDQQSGRRTELYQVLVQDWSGGVQQ